MALHDLPGPALLALGLLATCGFPAVHAQEAESLSARFRDAARAIQPAVVSVQGLVATPGPPIVPPTRIRVPGVDITAPGLMGPADTDPQTGSGVVVDAEKGLILTADHVVEFAEGLTVTLPDGQKRLVSAIVRDPESDLALLTIDPNGLTAATWGDSGSLDLGDWVLTVGSPFGLTGTVSAGIVSGKARSIHETRFEDLIQTDASVYPGSSGGPLVNLKGEVVGIVIAFQGESERGPSFAIPASRARRVADDLANLGRVRRAYLGVRLSENPESPGPGVLINAVEAGTPADQAGLKPGDVLQKVGDRPVSTPGEVRSLVEFAEVGKPLSLTVRRDHAPVVVEILPAEQPGRVVPAEPDLIRPDSLLPAPRGVLPPRR
ncbi:MAG TPA: trypsin-like peptidase domain-containing protein [Isosphaeraceae bacterium]|nr:trypsin-like peptidase domain-containing protein [Isosphaeraceae bacterium]